MKGKMVMLTVHLPRPYVEFLDRLVKARLYPNRAEAIRMAIRGFMFEEYDRLGEALRDEDESGGF